MRMDESGATLSTVSMENAGGIISQKDIEHAAVGLEVDPGHSQGVRNAFRR